MMYPAQRIFTERGRNGEFKEEDFRKALAHTYKYIANIAKTKKCEAAVNIKGMSMKEMIDKKYPHRGK